MVVVTHKDAHTAMAIPMMGYVLALTFPIYVNLFQKERMDAHRVSAVGIAPTEDKLELSIEGGKAVSQTHIEQVSAR
jgi:FHS family L-fucose permease-like MFS transporter